ncbi:MAG: TRAP transporter small permease [Treponema sp.]|nr:TRAP transporter small permease [Treponema sp.]
MSVFDRIVKIYKKLVNAICLAFESIAILSLALMFCAVMIQIVGRYFFRVTPGWTEEIARQLMILFSFIGMAIGVKNKGHIALSVFVDSIGRRPRLVIETCGKTLIVIMGIMMSINMGPFFTILRYNRLPGTGMPVGWRFVFPTAVGILIALIAAYQIYDHFKYGTDEEQKRKQLEDAATQGV